MILNLCESGVSTFALWFAVVLVNGWTDAPNAITTCVCAKALSFSAAARLAAVANLLGVLMASVVGTGVAEGVFSLAILPQGDAARAVLNGTLLSIVVWGVAAWWFGIPTSESHALIAGLCGALFAVGGEAVALRKEVFGAILIGLIASVCAGVLFGYCFAGLIQRFWANNKREKNGLHKPLHIAAAFGMAFAHGAQDGQKFIGLLMLIRFGGETQAMGTLPIWLSALCGLTMAFGTAIGGRRIVEKVGQEMVRLNSTDGLCADFSAVVCLLLCSALGMPVSTTHVKTATIIGVGCASTRGKVRISVVGQMVAAWVCTFPACGLLGYCFVKLWMRG